MPNLTDEQKNKLVKTVVNDIIKDIEEALKAKPSKQYIQKALTPAERTTCLGQHAADDAPVSMLQIMQHEDIWKKYDRVFNENIWPTNDLNQRFQAIVPTLRELINQQLEPQKILLRILQDYAWAAQSLIIPEDLDDSIPSYLNNSIPSYILKFSITAGLHTLCAPNNQRTVYSTPIQDIALCLTQNHFDWNGLHSDPAQQAITHQAIIRAIQQEKYDACLLPSHHGDLSNILYRRSRSELDDTQPDPALNDAFNHLDIRQYIKNQDPSSSGYLSYPPIDQHTLATALGEQQQNIKGFFVNINTNPADHPFWVLLTYHQATLEIYYPDFLANMLQSADHTDWETFKKTLEAQPLTCAWCPISHSDPCQDRDTTSFQDLDRITEWHATLLARIFPWVHQRHGAASNAQGVDLAHFRATIPLALSLQYAMTSCLHTADRTVHKEITQQFILREPFNAHLTQLVRYRDNNPGVKPFNESQETVLLAALQAKTMLLQFDQGILTLDPSKQLLTLDLSVLPPSADKQQTATIQAVSLMYYYGHALHRLMIILPQQTDQANQRCMQELFQHPLINALFQHTPHLQEISCTTSSCHTLLYPAHDIGPHIYHYTARNHFLQAIAPELAWSSAERAQIEQLTITYLTQFLQEHASVFKTLAFHRAVQDIKHHAETNSLPPLQQAASILQDNNPTENIQQTAAMFTCLTEMGTTGLEWIFRHQCAMQAINIDVESADHQAGQIVWPIDLSGNACESATNILEAHLNHLKQYYQRYQCYPSCSWWLPAQEVLNEPAYQEKLRELIGIFNQFTQHLPDSAQAIELDFYVNANNADTFFTLLEELVGKDLRVMIRLPMYDNAAITQDMDDHASIPRYYQRYLNIQCAILHNKQRARQAGLGHNVHPLIRYRQEQQPVAEQNTLTMPAADRYSLDHADGYPLPAEDTLTLPLTLHMTTTAGSAGQLSLQPRTQQVYTQQTQQHTTQTQQQQTQTHSAMATDIAIATDSRDEKTLITRDSIEERCRTAWDNQPEESKNHAGIAPQDDLSTLFSLWVGSDQNAPQVIWAMEPAAVEMLMQHNASFRLGVMPDNLPPGFYLAHSAKGQLILCFSQERHKLVAWSTHATDATTVNPYTIDLTEPLSPAPGYGDYQQYQPLTTSSGKQAQQDMQTLWQWCGATNNTLDSTTMQRYCQNNHHEPDIVYAPATFHYAIRQAQYHEPAGYEQCLSILSAWAKQQGVDEKFAAALFTPTSDLRLTENNLRAFGQLHHHFGIINNSDRSLLQGTACWLQLAYALYTDNEAHFRQWKTYCLDPSQNWCEILTQPAITAIVDSLRLKNTHPDMPPYWRQLFAAHGQAVGHVRYHTLWQAYQHFIDYLTQHCLHLTQIIWENTLDATVNFNGQVFLDRIQRMLNHMQEHGARQHLLDHLDQVDWTHSGAYYAVCYEGFPYWHLTLDLKHFKSPLARYALLTMISYMPQWLGYPDELGDASYYSYPILQALRFLAQRLSIPFAQFEQIAACLNEIANEHPTQDHEDHAPLLHRLYYLLACFAVGVDQPTDCSKQMIEQTVYTTPPRLYPNLIPGINQLLPLHGPLSPGTLQMHGPDVLTLLKAMAEIGTLALLEVITQQKANAKLSTYDAITQLWKQAVSSHAAPHTLNFINACGRVLRMYAIRQNIEQKTALKHFLNAYIVLAKQDINNTDTSTRHALVQTNQAAWILSPTILLYSFPWVWIGGIEGTTPATTPSIEQQIQQTMERTANTLFLRQIQQVIASTTSYGLAALQTFLQQCQTVDLTCTTWWPNQEQIEQALSHIARAQNEEQAKTRQRRVIIAWQDKKFAISQTDTAFRTLTDQEKQQLAPYLSPTFAEQNQALWQHLTPHLALPNTAEHTADLVQCYQTLKRIDQHDGDNNLGMVLGLLSTLAKQTKQHTKRYYAIPQLTQYLQLFLSDAQPQQHYPVCLFEAYLTHLISTPPHTLLNADLDQLSTQTTSLYTTAQNIIPALLATTLPEDCLLTLFKLALHTDKQTFEQIKNAFTQLQEQPTWLAAAHQLVQKLVSAQAEHLLSLTLILLRVPSWQNTDQQQALAQLWQRGHIQLIHELTTKDIDLSTVKTINSLLSADAVKNNATLQAILVHHLTLPLLQDPSHYKHLLRALWHWSGDKLTSLACYLAQNNITLSVQQFTALLKEKPSAADLIHHIDTVIQATRPDGTSKRDYSLTEQDTDNLFRLLTNIKGKKTGPLDQSQQERLLNWFTYLNHISLLESLDTISTDKLREQIHHSVVELRNSRIHSTEQPPEKPPLIAKLFACLREMALRKLGLWANHTQMLVLLNATLYPHHAAKDQLSLYQIATGEGKSLLTCLLASYYALMGRPVHLLSAKASLPERDWQAFHPLLAALNISSQLITPQSAATAYQQYQINDEETIGSIIFSTPDMLSLFLMRHTWAGTILPMPDKNTIAFIDEADALLENPTLFNLSVPTPGHLQHHAEPDPEAWVYKVIGDFYADLTSTPDTAKQNKIVIDQDTLTELRQRLINKQSTASKQSCFYTDYLAATLSTDVTTRAKAINCCNEQLRQLITATHTAAQLVADKHYCIQEQHHITATGTLAKRRTALVLDHNQVMPGASYSEHVQQCLATKLNGDAIKRGEQPNFFIPPYTRTALSCNTAALLSLYTTKTGVSATYPNNDTHQLLQKTITKIPKHHLSSVSYEQYFCENESAQVKQIINCIRQPSTGAAGPVLIACQDDRAVKHLAQQIQHTLSSDWHIIVDTNEKTTEDNIIAKVGQPNTLTLSARLHRGTDIPVTKQLILTVIVTFLAPPADYKQNCGRTARYDLDGHCIMVLNYADITSLAQEYSQLFPDLYQKIYQQETQRLKEKLAKPKHDPKYEHEHQHSLKFAGLADPEQQTKYLTSRAVSVMTTQLAEERCRYEQAKDKLCSLLSFKVMEILSAQQGASQSQSRVDHSALKASWIKHFNAILSAYHQHFDAIQHMNYATWREQAPEAWKQFLQDAQRMQHFQSIHSADSQQAIICDMTDLIQKTQPGTDFAVVKDTSDTSNPSAHPVSSTLTKDKITLTKDEIICYQRLVQWDNKLRGVLKQTMSSEDYASLNQLYATPECLKQLYGTLASVTWPDDCWQQLAEFTARPMIQLLSLQHIHAFIMTINDVAKLSDHERAVYFNTLKLTAIYQHDDIFDRCINSDTLHYFHAIFALIQTNLYHYLRFSHQQVFSSNRLYDIPSKDTSRENQFATHMQNFLDLFVASLKQYSEGRIKDPWGKLVELQQSKNPGDKLVELQQHAQNWLAILVTFSEHINRDDLCYCFAAFISAQKPARAHLIQYMQNNQNELCRSQTLPIRSLLPLLLSTDTLTLPPFAIFNRLGQGTKLLQWLAERVTTINAQDLTAFCKQLQLDNTDQFNGHINNEVGYKLHHQVLKLVVALPPFIPLAYITKQCFLIQQQQFGYGLGKEDGVGYTELFHQLSRAGKAFKKFLHTRGLSSDQTALPLPPAYRFWLNFFKALSPANNQILFEHLYQYVLQPGNPAKQEALLRHIGLAAAALLQDPTRSDVDTFTLPTATVQRLTTYACLLPLYQKFSPSARLFRQPGSYCLSPGPYRIYHQHWEQFTTALETVQSDHKITLPDQFIQFICSWYMTTVQNEHTATDATNTLLTKHLQQAVLVYQTILGKEQKNWIPCLQYATHGLLKEILPEQTIATCFDRYRQVLADSLCIDTNSQLNKTAHQQQKEHYQKLINRLTELATISQHPFTPATPCHDARPNQNQRTIYQANQQLFAKQAARYQQCWWTNAGRRNLANGFFNTLKNVSQNSATAAYYDQCFNNIRVAQEQLLVQDQQAAQQKQQYYNKKGYSRLYDMMDQLFLTLAKQCLTNQALTTPEKVHLLSSHLTQQLKTHLQVLQARLPGQSEELHTLLQQAKGALEPSTINPQSAEIFKKLQKASYTNLPQHLHYLMDSVHYYATLLNSPSLLHNQLEMSAATNGVHAATNRMR